jgi:hypothetical protein
MDIDNKEFLLFLGCAQENKLRYLCIGGYAPKTWTYGLLRPMKIKLVF